MRVGLQKPGRLVERDCGSGVAAQRKSALALLQYFPPDFPLWRQKQIARCHLIIVRWLNTRNESRETNSQTTFSLDRGAGVV
jgi:hypothetical protein